MPPLVAVDPIAPHSVRLLTADDVAPRTAGQRTSEPLINTEQAAVLIGIHPKTLQKYARRGLIRGIQVGRRWRFRASTIDDWIARAYAD